MFEHFEHPFQQKSSIFWGISISGMKLGSFSIFSENSVRNKLTNMKIFIPEIEMPQKIEDFCEKSVQSARTCVSKPVFLCSELCLFRYSEEI